MIWGHLLKALAQVIHIFIQVYIVLVIIRSFLSWFGHIPSNRLIVLLKQITNPVFRLTYRFLPFLVKGGIDFSPILIVFLLYFFDNFLVGYLINYSNLLVKGG